MQNLFSVGINVMEIRNKLQDFVSGNNQLFAVKFTAHFILQIGPLFEPK